MASKTTAKSQYNDQSIKALKGADRVRKRPGVIFGSDGLEGCEHSFFEILSNSVDEAREGHGNEIKVTAFADRSIKVDDHGRGVPLVERRQGGRFGVLWFDGCGVDGWCFGAWQIEGRFSSCTLPYCPQP